MSETHKAQLFHCILNRYVDKRYPEGDKIRIILENLSARTKNASCDNARKVRVCVQADSEPLLNLIEKLFSKMRRQLLRGLRVDSKAELAELIYKYIEQDNEESVIFHWNFHMDEIDPSEEVKIDLAI